MKTTYREYFNAVYSNCREVFDTSQLISGNSLPEKSSFFIFDLNIDKCKFFSSAIKKITGYSFNQYIHKGIVFFKTLIHPEDYSDLVSELLTYIFMTKEQKVYGIRDIQIKVLTCRIRHKDGCWVKTRMHVMYLTCALSTRYNILTGIIEKMEHQEYENLESNNNITNREKEVLQLIGNGDSSKIIADKLNISETTAISHRKNLIQKLHVKNTAELIKEAVKAKIIE